MRHAAPKAHKGLGAKSLTNSLFASRTGSHSAQGVRAKQAAAGDAQALAIDEDLAAKLNEVAPLTRKAIRQTAKAAQRKHNILTSVSLATLVGTAATSMAFMKGEGSTVLAAEGRPRPRKCIASPTVPLRAPIRVRLWTAPPQAARRLPRPPRSARRPPR